MGRDTPVKRASRWSWRELVALLLLILACSLAWSKRIGGGDTFVSLAAGRDTLAGKMGLPDEWSFTSEGRVWLDQNWGSHTTYYVAYRLFGDPGPVAVKWLVIFAMMLLMVRAATDRGADWCFAVALVSVTILVARTYLDVRPHIFTLLFESAMIVVLFQWYKGSAAWAFVAAALIGLWTNMHGGFVFGLGVMGLWLGVQTGLKLIWSRSRPWGWSHLGILAVALGVALALAALANPFGPVNLTHPLVVEKSKVWLSVQEWHPILDFGALARDLTLKQSRGFGSVTEFLVLMGIFAATLVGWGLVRLMKLPSSGESSAKQAEHGKRRDGRQRPRQSKEQGSRVQAGSRRLVRSALFDAALAAVVITMAFKARRFIPLATVAIVPIMAALLTDMMSRIRHAVTGRAPGATAWGRVGRQTVAEYSLALILIGLILTWGNVLVPYRDPNPVYPKQTVLMRMVGSQTFPQKAIDFLLAQDDIPAEAFVDWRWEGYTRWRTDRLKTFCGGRAQQIHSEEVAKWQIPTPNYSAKRLQVNHKKDVVRVDNSYVSFVVGQQKNAIADLGMGRAPLGRLGATVAVREDGKTVRYPIDRLVGWRFHEQTEYWVDIDIAVERSVEPKYRAEFRLTILGVPPKRICQGAGYCTLRLLRLTNTGKDSLHIVGHSLMIRSLQQSGWRPVGKSPITFWQGKELRYGLAVAPVDGGMLPRVERSLKPPQLEAIGRIDQMLAPNQACQPEHAASLFFVQKAEAKYPPMGTLSLLHYLEMRQSCRRLVDAADRHGINVVLLPKGASGFVLLLMGSKQWTCVFDDVAAYVLLKRKNPKNQRIIKKILAGEAEYPEPYLKALGMALARRSEAPANTNPRALQQELKAALRFKADYSIYWWLLQLHMQYPHLRHPQALGKDLSFWQEQWERLSASLVDRQREVRIHESKREIARILHDCCKAVGKQEEAAKWAKESRDSHVVVRDLHRTYQ